jgi:hypothetical protein
MGNLLKELPVSEMVSTFEQFSYFGVTREDLALLRSSPNLTRRLCAEIKQSAQIADAKRGWNHYDGEDSADAFRVWSETYDRVLALWSNKRNFFVVFRHLLNMPKAPEYVEAVIATIKDAMWQMKNWPDAVKKSGYALPIRKIAALIAETPEGMAIIQKKYHFDPSEFAVSLGGSDPRKALTGKEKVYFGIALAKALS